MAGKVVGAEVCLCFENTVFFLMLLASLDDKPTT
jgi:hypothetical protein